MSDDTSESQIRRAAHRRGHSMPMHERAQEDRDLSSFTVSVSRFADGGVLNASNFDAAFRAAVQWCYDQIGDSSTDNLVNLKGASYNVKVPAGIWPMQPVPVLFPGLQSSLGLTGYATPGVVGEGTGASQIVVMGDLPSADRGLFELGTNGQYTYRQRFAHFSIRAFGGSAVGNGIVGRACLRLDIDDVDISGFQASQKYTGGFGLQLIGVNGTPVQHANLNKLRIQGCQSGLRIEQAYEVTGTDVWVNQCSWRDIVAEGSIATFRSGNLQSDNHTQDGDPAAAWYSKTLTPCVSGGWGNVVLAGGNSATLGTASYAADADTGLTGVGSCTVTGLTGLTVGNVGDMLELTGPNAFAPRNDLVSGLYEITAVAAAGTSCTILKGTNHSSTGSVTWRVLGATGSSSIEMSGFPYHEGGRRCVVQTDKGTLGDSSWVLNGIIGANTIALRSGGGSVVARGIGGGGGVIDARLVHTEKFDSDVQVNRIAYDNYSRYGMVSRNFSSTKGSTGIWQGAHSSRSRLNSWAIDRGVFAFDARRTDKLTLATTDVQQMRCVSDDTITLGPQNAAQYASFVASDAVTGTAAINCSGGATGSAKNLIGTISSAKFPTNNQPRVSPTLLAIVRVASATPVTQPRRVSITDASIAAGELALAINENAGGFAGGNWFSYFSIPASGGGTVQIKTTQDTNPHAMALRWDQRAAGRSGRGLASDETSYGVESLIPNLSTNQQIDTWPFGSIAVNLNRDYGQTVNPLVVFWVGVCPFALTDSEIEQFMDLASAEFKVLR